MDDVFKIYVDQLRDGRVHHIHEILPPDFLDVHESDLAFDKPVKLEGEAYLAENELVLHWNIQAGALVACSICNEKVLVPLSINNFYYSEPLENIKSGIFNFKELLRETILLEVPPFAEHQDGNCPKRKEIAKYLREPSDEETDEGYQPFADFEWKDKE